MELLGPAMDDARDVLATFEKLERAARNLSNEIATIGAIAAQIETLSAVATAIRENAQKYEEFGIAASRGAILRWRREITARLIERGIPLETIHDVMKE